MQLWQIKALELEASELKHLDGFIRDRALYFLIGVIFLLLALLEWVLSGGLRRNGGKTLSCIQPTIIIQLPETPPQPAEPPFDPFPLWRECDCEHDHDQWTE
jgi:hypothetical protein